MCAVVSARSGFGQRDRGIASTVTHLYWWCTFSRYRKLRGGDIRARLQNVKMSIWGCLRLRARTGCDLDLRRIFSQRRSRSGCVKTVNFRIGHFRSFGQRILNNLNWSAKRKLVVKRSHIARFHPDATETGRPANYFLLVGSVNVNAAMESMRIGSLQTAQPNNARHHRIASGSVWVQNFASPTTIMKYGSHWSMVADFLCDLQKSEWRSEAAPVVTQTVLGSGNRIRRGDRSVLD